MENFRKVQISLNPDDAGQLARDKAALGQDETPVDGFGGVAVTHVGTNVQRAHINAGGDVRPASGLEPFRDMEQVYEAMQDPRWTSPYGAAYRADVEARMAAMATGVAPRSNAVQQK